MREPKLVFVVGMVASALLAGCAGSVDGAGDDDLSEAALSSPERSAFNFFVSKGLTKVQAAGVVGNLMQESNVNAGAVQYGGGPGRGIAQWSVGGRWDHDHNDNVVWYANNHGGSRWALGMQLDFTWYELATFSGYGLGALRASNSVTAAVVAFQNRFEGCGTCDQSRRIQYANQVLSAYGGPGGGGAGCYSNTLGKE